jgi:hypothetical protein
MCELLCKSSLLANSVNGRSAADLTAQDHGQPAPQFKVIKQNITAVYVGLAVVFDL